MKITPKISFPLIITFLFFSCNNNVKKSSNFEEIEEIEIEETIIDNSSEIEIKELFQKINLYESENKGEKLFELADSKTKSYYNNLLNISINADSTFVRNQNIFDKMMILLIRGRYNLNELETLNEEKLFADFYDKLIVVPSIVKDRVLLNLKIQDSFATAELNSGMIKYSKKKIVEFIKENNEWKYSFTSFYEINAKDMAKMLNESEETEDEYLRYIVGASGVKKIIKIFGNH